MGAPMADTERLEAAKVRQHLPGALLKVKESGGETYLCVERTKILEVLQLLRDDLDLQYSYFAECVGVDYSTWTHERDLTGRFEVVYNLMSLKHYSRIFVKVAVDDGQTIPTAKHLYLGAEYPEKEIGDLYGIIFTGNELAKGERFLLADEWNRLPPPKEYPLGGEDVLFDKGDRGPAVEDIMRPHAGESFEGKTGTDEVSGR